MTTVSPDHPIYHLPLGDVRIRTEGKKSLVHVQAPMPEPRPSRTLCNKIVSGHLWWRGIPESTPEFHNPFTGEPAVTCPACLAKMGD